MRVVRDSTINQVFDKVVHLAWLVVNLVDFFDLNAWDFQILYINLAERAVYHHCQLREGVGAGILTSGDVKDAKVLECHHQGVHLDQVLGHHWILSFVFANHPSHHRKSVKTFKCSTLRCFASFKLIKKASYLIWLLVTLNERRRVYSTTILSRLTRINLAPLLWKFEAVYIEDPSYYQVRLLSGRFNECLLGHVIWQGEFYDKISQDLCLYR